MQFSNRKKSSKGKVTVNSELFSSLRVLRNIREFDQLHFYVRSQQILRQNFRFLLVCLISSLSVLKSPFTRSWIYTVLGIALVRRKNILGNPL